MFKVYRVNTKNKSVQCENFKEEYKTFGNRGLIARVMTEEVNPMCDPMGPDNKLIISTGILAGTPVTTAHRLSVGGKSPLTGGIKESNVGGNVASLLSQQGIKMIIFEDMPDDDRWYIFKINKNGSAELVIADEYAGLNNYKLVEIIHDKYGKDVGVLSIGVAGERGYKNSSMQATDAITGHPVRAAARGGLGAVAGSKRIKAIIVEKPLKKFEFPYVNKQIFDEGNKKFVSTFLELDGGLKILHEAGTVGLIADATLQTGIAPVKNYSGVYLSPEKQEMTNGKAWLSAVEANGGKHGLPCQPGCLIRCSNVYNNSKGEFITSGLEYETYIICGPNCNIANIDFVAEVDRICDDFGVDTIEIGCTLGVLMDKGIITWGDEQAALDALKQMIEGKTELGRLMGEGTERLGKVIGAKRIPTVKGQSMAAYDPRNLKGVGVTYATSPMGADHTAGITFVPGIDHTDKNGKVALSKSEQNFIAAADNFMCFFAFANGTFDQSIYPQMMKGALGVEYDLNKVLEIGTLTLKMEREWNLAAGFTKEDDHLPDFFYNDVSTATESVFDITPEEMQRG